MQVVTVKMMGVNVKVWRDDNGDMLCRLWDRNVIQIADRFRDRCSSLAYGASSRKSALRTAERIAAALER